MTGRAGRFITVEGLEGAGKTTCLEAVRDALAEHGVEAPLFTREPGGTPFAEALRGLLLDPQYSDLGVEAEVLTVFAARAEHLQRVVYPALEQGRWVVSDRFTDATYAYQGGGRGLGEARIAALEEWVHGGFGPDLTLLLDVDIGVGRQRVTARGGAPDRFEGEREAFFEAARAAYWRRAQAEPARFRCIDANQPPEAVAAEIYRAVAELVTAGRGGWP